MGQVATRSIRTMSGAENRAVFLSYASQDADAARRICEALRTAGVEVWFDQSELRGGDAWDAKIRKQIKECALFVPVISANTQARLEGYFRLEWRLADQRSHLMAKGKAFLLPVVIDDTRDSAAHVPDSFLEVQWTRLPRGEMDPAFSARVKQLLGGAQMSSSTDRAGTAELPELRKAGERKPAKARMGAIAITAVAIITLGALAWWQPWNPRTSSVPIPTAADKSIAVLPFANLSDDKESGFFADGVQEDILTNLALIRELRVVSRTSVGQYRDTRKKMPEIARELGVTYLVEGSVRRAGGSVRISAQLIRAGADEHLWAKGFDGELKDVFALQSALATEIAGALHAAITPQEQKLIARRPTQNSAAYDLYLKARRIRDGGMNFAPMVQDQIKLLEAAVVLDPGFALAWGDLAWCHGWFYGVRGIAARERTPSRLEKAKAAMASAVRLAPDAPETTINLGYHYYFVFDDYARSAEQFEKLLALQPNNTAARFGLSMVQRALGRYSEDLANKLLVARQDPGNGDYVELAAERAHDAHRYDEAAALTRRLVELHPDDPWQRLVLAYVEFAWHGSTRAVDEFFESLPPAELNSPRGILEQRNWALTQGKVTAALRFENLRAVDGGKVSWSDAVRIAAAMMANGDRASARARLAHAPEDLHVRIKADPSNAAALWAQLGMVEALLGNKAEALRCVGQATEMLSGQRSAAAGTAPSSSTAFVLAWTGDKEGAIAEYARLLLFGTRSVNVHAMKSDPRYHPLRGDPRFEALLNDPKNNAPLF